MKTIKIAIGLVLGLALLQPKIQGYILDQYPDSRIEQTNKGNIPQGLVAKLSYKVLNDPSVMFVQKKWDDKSEEEVFNRFLSSLDFSNMIIVEKERARLKKLPGGLQEAIGNTSQYKNSLLVERTYNVYQNQLTELEQEISVILNSPATYTYVGQENYQQRDEKSTAPQDSKERMEIWTKYMKNLGISLKLEGKTDEEVKQILISRSGKWMKRMKAVDENQVFANVMNAYTAWFDPHTTYLPPSVMPDMIASWSLTMQGVGIVIANEGDGVVIKEISKNGPAAQSSLKVGDQIISVGQGEKGELVDVSMADADEVVKLIRGKEHTKVKLVVKSKVEQGDLSREVVLERKQIKLTEKSAKEKTYFDEKMKVGVISLPGFYAGMGQGKVSASEDVKKLIEELKSKGMNSLVIDLRDNGGGAIKEAVDLVGLFVQNKPAVVTKSSTGTLEVLRTSNKRPAWEGPLTILVNHNSASASELFAAAIQDYGRGIIVGENTFGKGSVQYVYDFDEIAEKNQMRNTNMGSLKVTIAQFYRVSGKSTQNNGVKPDVEFKYMSLDADIDGENKLPNALPVSKIEPVKGFVSENRIGLLSAQLQKSHDLRTAQSEKSKDLENRVIQYRKYRDNKIWSLNLSTRQAQFKEQDEFKKTQESSTEKTDVFLQEAIKVSEDALKLDERVLSFNK